MAIESTLPTFGAAPPNIRRASIPRALQPDVPDAAKNLRRRSESGQKPQLPEQKQQNFLAESPANPSGGNPSDGKLSGGRPLGVAGGTILSGQVSEDPKPAPVSRAGGPSRIEQAIAQSNAEDADENAAGLTDEEQAYVQELQAIDREVRSHEAAHAAVGGAYAGRPTYEYVTGPDGIRYAVSGRVQIDSGTIAGDPEGTIDKLETVRRSALAPSKPSGQDRAVAAQAEAGIRAAQAEINAERAEETDALLSDETPVSGEGAETTNRQATDAGDPASTFGPDQSAGSDQSGASAATKLLAQAAFSQALGGGLLGGQGSDARLDLLA